MRSQAKVENFNLSKELEEKCSKCRFFNDVAKINFKIASCTLEIEQQLREKSQILLDIKNSFSVFNNLTNDCLVLINLITKPENDMQYKDIYNSCKNNLTYINSKSKEFMESLEK